MRALRLSQVSRTAASLVSLLDVPSREHALNLGSLLVACGKTCTGYTAAINQLTFGAPPGAGAGDACGRCFRLTGKNDPHTKKQVTKKEITVKVIDLCSIQGNEACCGQSNSKRVNDYGQSVQCVNFSLFPAFVYRHGMAGVLNNSRLQL